MIGKDLRKLPAGSNAAKKEPISLCLSLSQEVFSAAVGHNVLRTFSW